jgi:hypothetical protein
VVSHRSYLQSSLSKRFCTTFLYPVSLCSLTSSNHPDFGLPTVLAVSYALWFPAFTFTNKCLLNCIQGITKCVANVIAVKCCDASVVEWLWGSGGILGKSSTWIFGQVRQRFCSCPENLSRTKMNPRFVGSRYSFQTSHYWHGFSLTTASLTWKPSLPVFQHYTQGPCHIFKKVVMTNYTRNLCTWWSTSNNTSPYHVFIFLAILLVHLCHKAPSTAAMFSFPTLRTPPISLLQTSLPFTFYS